MLLTLIRTIGWIQTGMGIYVAMHLIGISLFLECVLLTYQIKPIPSSIRKYILHIIGLLALGAVTGVFLFDIAGIFILRLWEYPAFSSIKTRGDTPKCQPRGVSIF